MQKMSPISFLVKTNILNFFLVYLIMKYLTTCYCTIICRREKNILYMSSMYRGASIFTTSKKFFSSPNSQLQNHYCQKNNTCIFASCKNAMYPKYIDLMILKMPSITRHTYKKSFRQNDDTNFHPYVQWLKLKFLCKTNF